MSPSLPTADPWYGVARLDDRVTRITEPHVHPVFSANMHLVEGRDADLLIDSGMGVAPLRPVVDAARRDPGKPLTLLTTHAHVDHVGAAHEFDAHLAHPMEREALARPPTQSLQAGDIPENLRTMLVQAGYPPLEGLLVAAVPAPRYDPDAWTLRPAPLTGEVVEGDTINLGDWRAEILHLPGHAPGQVGLWHAETGTLFGADAVYDGPLVAPEADRAVYAATLRRLRALPVRVVHGGHDDPFGPERLSEICDGYLALWEG
ncbi:glyoxylase-like metal-dependent hydrolase (beta-lactamase superfamily II) [Palleronia aestuarii]|uniref:Glyoxylase-like metal-dependent hydrolase (Beta-lactamase superfamily II) n=1 Tax=Palleronia aestuarii TaxID=568105 RepID=A0A2W7NJV5_9RHOB|nr:MBL fold metallo-hydrolase [Palleronia aestuarii]PZX13466.1 glyoxylase-like metal-dependent hydrolase (beta-lactamase superfamily II) [Palleronia aestuarii]